MKILTEKGKTLDLSEVRKTFTSIHPNVTISEGDTVIPLLDALEAIFALGLRDYYGAAFDLANDVYDAAGIVE